MIKFLQLSLLIALVVLATANNQKYYGAKVVRVDVPDEEHAKFLAQYDGTYDFWTGIRIGKHVDIMLLKDQLDFLQVLENNGYTYTIPIEDLGVVTEERRIKREAARAASKERQADFDFNIYHTYDEIQTFLQYVADTYSTASLENIGQSYEGRDMNVLKICSGNCGDMPVMYIECDIHAREWLTSAVCLNLIDELTGNAAANSRYTDNLDWYFLLPANPDGYVYTWTDDRFWRKTRKPNQNSACIGTDPNRNWDDHFDEGGASDFPCSDTWHGDTPFSEPCTANIRDFVMANRGDIAYFMDMHAYSEYAMFPYGWTRQPCTDNDRLQTLCDAAELSLENVNGVSYQCGPIAIVIYVASGSSVDWAYDIAGITRSYTIETRPGPNQGLPGFDPDESEIEPTSNEIWAWHKAIADDIIASGPNWKK